MARLLLRIDEARLGFEGRFHWGPWAWTEARLSPWRGDATSLEALGGVRLSLLRNLAFAPYGGWNFEFAAPVFGLEAFFDAEFVEIRPRIQLGVAGMGVSVDYRLQDSPAGQARVGFLYARRFDVRFLESAVALTTSLSF